MSKTPVAGIEDRAPGERASSQGKALIQPTDVRGAGETFADMVTEIDPGTGRPVAESAAASAAPTSAPAAAPSPALPDLPELEEVRRVHGETGVAQVLEAVQQVQAHIATERAKLSELIPDWRDATTRALEIPEIIKFARSRGATDEQIAAFDRFGTAAELKNWRDFWRASHTGRRADERAEPAPAPGPPAAASRPAVDARQQARAEREARLQEAYERSAKTHRLRDAGDTFAALLIEKPE